MQHRPQSEIETIRIAQELVPEIRPDDVILLHGTLGSGKTVFARTLIRALVQNPEEEVPSPTFTLVQHYEGKAGPISHYDLYRLEDAEEIYELGWEDSLASGITIVEWPERLGTLIPARRLDIRLASVENNPQAREIHIERRA